MPNVSRQEYTVIDISEDGFVSPCLPLVVKQLLDLISLQQTPVCTVVNGKRPKFRAWHSSCQTRSHGLQDRRAQSGVV